ncbi:MAG: hypothetical protein Q8M92_04355 [Candidatus Subteraquimicrobiales bacterium]|nr:hypothetical protein [Candidatus Subteraquimicrobiales bacterium]
MKIEKIKKENILEKNSLSLEAAQTKLDNYGGSEIDELGSSKTEIKKTYEEAGFIHYEVKMSSETIKDPIYIFDEGYFEWTSGYQKIDTFSVRIDTSSSKMFIFAPKQIADILTQRLKKAGYISLSKLPFDFSRVGELTNLDSAWGLWEDSVGIIRRIAKFGKGINAVITDYAPITTFYIDYKYRGDEIVQLILSSEGRISTNKNLTHRELSIIYDDISKTLIKKV